MASKQGIQRSKPNLPTNAEMLAPVTLVLDLVGRTWQIWQIKVNVFRLFRVGNMFSCYYVPDALQKD